MSSGSKVLIVDDETIGRQLLEAVLFSEGFELEFAADGQEAYDKAKQLVPDLILMDVMMPHMDGFEVCKKIREDESLQKVPIVLITALDDRDSRLRGLDAGADDYISKPFDRIEVLAKVRNITQLKKSRTATSEKETPTVTPKKESKESIKETVQSEYLSYSGIIQKSLLLEKGDITNVFPDSFILSHSSSESEEHLYYVNKKGDKAIILLISAPNNHVQSIFFRITLIASLQAFFSKNEIKSPVNLLEHIFSNWKAAKIQPFIQGNIGFTACVFNQKSLEIDFTGVNTQIYLSKKGEVSQIELEKYQGNKYPKLIPKSEKLNKGDNIYLLSSNISQYFTDKNTIKPNLKDITQVLRDIKSLDIPVQKFKLEEIFSQIQQQANTLQDYLILGMKVN